MPNGEAIINNQSKMVKSIKGGTKRLTVTGNTATQASAMIMQSNVAGFQQNRIVEQIKEKPKEPLNMQHL